MNRLLLLLALLCLPLFGWAQHSAWPKPILEDPGMEARREMLLSHGVNPTTAELLKFLQEGFPKNLSGGLPDMPVLKSGVVNAAIEELGITASESAVPALMDIAARKPSDAVMRIIARDFERSPVEVIDQQMERMRQVLSLNAVVALGLIGDSRAADTILNLIRTETATAFVTKGAIALGQMGSSAGLPALGVLASNVESPDCPVAFRAVYTVTGRNYGVTENTSLARKREKVAQLKDWLDTAGKDIQVFRLEVIRRMSNPPLEEPLEPASLRGVLRASRDLASYDRRYAARRELQGMAPERFEELKTIAGDPLEDLDIRRAALTWLAAAKPKEARRIVRRQQDDENPSIAEYTKVLERDIDAALEAAKK